MMSYAYNTFSRKGYGRIFCNKEEDVPKIREIIERMDDFEYEYLPDELITVYRPEKNTKVFSDGSKHYYIPLEYTHKFDSLDLNELQMRCMLEGIQMFCWIGGHENGEFIDVWED